MLGRLLTWIHDLFDPYPFVRSVIVTTKSGRIFRGVLWRRRRGFLVLRRAEQLHPDKTAVMDGELVIDRANLDFLQVLAATEGA